MENEEDLQEIRNEILRKIGKNLYNFQLLEKLWEKQLKAANLKFAVSKDGSHSVSRYGDRGRPKPMGWLTSDHTKHVFGPRDENDPDLNVEERFSIEYSFRREGDSEDLTRERRHKLRRLVEDRNKLVHGLLDLVDMNSIDSCRKLSQLLDEQADRIKEEGDYLDELTHGMRIVREEMARYIMSDEFAQSIKRNPENDT